MIGVWPPLPPSTLARRPRPTLPFPLGRPDCSLFARARHGLWQGVQALGLEPGDAVLVPAYHHGSEVEALVGAGLECRFYEAGPTLEPNVAELDGLVDERVRALHLTHYLGFPQDAAQWRRWCDERGLFLLEDAAQAWLSSVDGAPVGSVGHLAVFCLYKSVGVPDGAALVVDAPVPAAEARARAGVAGAGRRHLLWALQRSDGLGWLATGRGRERRYDAGEDFALGDPGTPPSIATSALLPRLAEERVATVRRVNYGLLLEELGDRVPEPFGALPAGASPFAFPVETDNKRALLEGLRNRGIAALDFWSVPHPHLLVNGFPGAAARRSRTVALPVHQELRPGDLDLIASAAATRRRRRPTIRLERVASISDLAAEWDALAERTENIFATPDWAETWWDHFGGRREPMIIACRTAGGRLAGILPLYLLSVRPLRILRFIGHGPADELGPVCAPEDRTLVAGAVRRALDDARADVLLAENLSGDSGWGSLLGGAVLKREASPVLDFAAGSWDELRATWSANLRQQAGRLERKLAREHDLRYELTAGPADLQRDLDDLFALHAARWGRGSAFLGGREAFHREFASRALTRERLRLWFLVAGGRRVAAWYGFRVGKAESFYQAGRNPDWEAHSVGFVVLLHSIRSALEDGMREYRFLRGEERFKYRLASRDPGLESLAIADGPLGLAATTAGRVLRGPLVPLLERRLAGHVGSPAARSARE